MKENMKQYGKYGAMGLLGFIIASILIGCDYSPMERFNDLMGLKDDNMLEESAENLIRDKIGLEIDLTPRSEE